MKNENMKLNKEEEILLEIEKFLIEMMSFLNIKDITVQLYSLNNNQMKFNPKKRLAPLCVTVIRHDTLKSEYIFQDGSDDEYPQTDKLGNHIGYLDMKKLIQEKLPITLNNKAIYQKIESHNFGYKLKYSSLKNNDILNAIKIKNDYINLKDNLLEKKQDKKLNFKI